MYENLKRAEWREHAFKAYTLGYITSQQADWKHSFDDMIAKGAPLLPCEF